MSTHKVGAGNRLRQIRRLLATEGIDGITERVRRRGAALLSPRGSEPLPVSRNHLAQAADVAERGFVYPPPLEWSEGEPLRIAWVDVPPSIGSGGQLTIYRMIEMLEAAGHECVVYLLDRHGWSLDQHRATIAEWLPNLRAQICDVADGIADAHAIVATCWESVYPVMASPARGARLYFVQDFEPLFYPAGSNYLLAESTYRVGFHGVTAGRWLAEKLRTEYGMSADHFDFGSDLSRYGLLGREQERTDVCYYCRPSTPRRAHELAVAALDLFAQRHPEVTIHLYGERPSTLPFRAEVHGSLTPAELNRLYNRCIGGLALSATNVSLVPHEMLAAGCIPVVNDAAQNRIVLDNDHVAYASATPFELAAVMHDLVTSDKPEQTRRATQAARSVADRGWSTAGEQVEQAIRRHMTALS